jgi:hypothetical protein
MSSTEALEYQYITELYPVSSVDAQLPEVVLKQIWFQPNQVERDYFDMNPGALEKSFLVDVLESQQVLLNGIPNGDSVFLHTPLVFWGNDMETLKNDQSPIRTINSQLLQSQYSHSGLISGGLKVNGIVRSADAVRILMMYLRDSPVNYGKIWDENVKQLQNSKSSFILRHDKEESLKSLYILEFTRMIFLDHFVLTCCYLLIGLYIIISLSNLSMVTSKLGLLFAFITEMALSIFSAATLTTYFFNGVDFFEIPLQLIPFLVIVCGVENMFRVITTISQTPGELSVTNRLSKAMERSGLTSTLVMATDLLILRIFYPNVVPSSKIFCIFASFAIIIDHIFHLTFFASVLSIDVCRLELRDLIEEPPKFLSLGEEPKISTFSKVKTQIKRISLPFSTTLTGFVIIVLFIVLFNLRWMGHSYRSDIQSVGDSVNFLEKKVFSGEVSQLLEKYYSKRSFQRVLISADRPIIAVHDADAIISKSFTLHAAYRFDIFYVLEFLTLLVFALSLSMIALKYFTANLTSDEDKPLNKISEKERSFQAKVLSGSHFLDIIKITTSRSPFIVSVGLDHKVLIWSPLAQPIPIPSQLPLIPGTWPITNIVLSDHGNYIAVFSKSGVVQCWSRLSMTWIWRFEFEELKNTATLEAFFRHRTVPAFALRKKRNQLLKQSIASPPGSRRNSMRSITSPRLSATVSFSNNTNVSNELEDLVIVLKTGEILTIPCQGSSPSKEKLTDRALASCAKLSTPRVNDRLISYTEDGKILVSTAVNNKWKSRFVTVDQHRFNNPGIVSPEKPDETSQYSKSAIAIVPFVGFMVRTCPNVAELIDVQTGILIKSFPIRNFKRGSLRVFHDQPTHCRFCGSASIASFSVAYTLAESNTVVMHTFTVDHHAKTSICLRVERDPREIRCVGFDQVTEHVNEHANVEGWCVTDTNQIMGIKRRSEEKNQEHGGLRRRHNGKREEKEYDLWDGWTLSAHGKFETYDIPSMGKFEGLLVNSVSQIAKFGHKSIVVGFGNIMKVLYLGNDDLVYHDDDKPANEAISGLSFVEKRRRNIGSKKSVRSTNYGELDGIPGISELAL